MKKKRKRHNKLFTHYYHCYVVKRAGSRSLGAAHTRDKGRAID